MVGGDQAEPALTVPDLLAARAAAEPDHIALAVDDGAALTVREWHDRAVGVAHGLLRLGIGRGDRVGLVLDDWLDFAVAYCGTHLAAAVAVPLSAGRPADERAALLADCSVTIHSGFPLERLDPTPIGPLPAPPEPDDLAQVLYTSGTTGRPKGVAARHANLTAGQARRPRHRALAHSTHLVHAMPIGTNAGQTMLLNALTAHPTVLSMTAYDSERLARLVETHRIGSVFLVPPMAIDLVRSGALGRHDVASVRLLGSTGAPLPPATAAALAAALPGATIVNYYTSTEAAPTQTTMVFDPARPGSVGRAVRGDDIRVTAEDGSVLPAGATGVVWLRSAAAPREYVDDPAATAAVFRDGWTRMGDVGFLDRDGYLQLVDRESDLITTGAFKVSSLRVEAELYAHPDITDAAVVAVPHPVMGAMVGAAVTATRPVAVDEIRAFLRDRLARHELPARVALVDALPRNEAGKVLKRQLDHLFAPAATRPVEASTVVEESLVQIWARVLDRRTVSRDDEFFALGGDSLRAAQVATLVGDVLHRHMLTSDVLDHPRLSDQARWLEAAPVAAPAPAAPGPAPRSAPLTAVQRVWVRWMSERAGRRVIPLHVAIRVDEPFDPGLAADCLAELVTRHEALRTIVDSPDTWYAGDGCPLETSTVDAPDEAAAVDLAGRFVESWSAGPTTRALTVRLGDGASLFVLCVEHLAGDGWSIGLLLRELALLYSARRTGRELPLPPVPVRPSDVAAWACSQWTRTRPLWADLRAEPARALAGQRTDALSYDGAAHEFALAPPLMRALTAEARRRGATPMQATLAAWAAVVGAHTDGAEVTVVTPLSGRVRKEFEPVVGCLIQQPILRLPGTGGIAAVDRVRAAVAAGVDRQFYPFHEFADRAPHPAYFFYESWARPAHLPGLASTQVRLPPALATRWPMTPGDPDLSPPRLRLTERGDGGVDGCLVYNRDAFAAPAVERLATELVDQCARLTRGEPD